MRYINLIQKFHRTKGYKYNEEDIFIEYDNYLCVIQVERCNNIIFIKLSDIHKNSLCFDVNMIIDRAITNGVSMFMINNKRWKVVLNNMKSIVMLYENGEFCIYGRK